ncbi:MAG: phosphoribosyltransferase family protein [Bacteroides sp.]|nr:phosphoribosyltransferase family protein [Bacteroides sp.]
MTHSLVGAKDALRAWTSALWHLFFPSRCVVCGNILNEGEEGLCLRCNMDLPRTNYHLEEGNPVERMFWGKFTLERATAYFYYQKGSDFRNLLHQLKYGGRKDLGEVMGRFVAMELEAVHFFRDMDVIVPVPLHPRKERMRGYNQSRCIAEGVSRVTGIPVDASSVVRCKHTESQTRKSVYERWENTEGIFQLRHPKAFVGKHVLIIDDVLTTGATTTACADAFAQVEGVRISVLTLAVAN